jgi:hemoglobin
LVTLGPLLDHRPEWQKLIGDSLADAQRNASIGQRAFVLRGVLDKIRSDINPKKPDVGTKAPPLIGSPGAPPSVPPGTGGSPAGKTLWDRLGGEPTVTKVIDDFVDLAATDIKVNFDRDGKYKLEPTAVAAFKKQMVAFASSATGGPIKYEGKNMKDAHKDMGITEAEFNALAADLKRALEKNGVKPDEAKAVLDLVESTRKDIVQPK